MTAESLAHLMGEFLGGSRNAVVVEDGARIFDLNESKYSISGEYNKYLLHLWPAERNVVRRILDSEIRNGNLPLMVQKLGQSRPSKIDICKGHDHRTPTARRRGCFWLPPLCTSIPQPTQYCEMWIPRSIGRGWGSMNGGGRS